MTGKIYFISIDSFVKFQAGKQIIKPLNKTNKPFDNTFANYQ